MPDQPHRNSYTIDANDRIVAVAAEWDRFAIENDGADIVEDSVIGRSLWDFIAGDTTRQIYQQMIAKVRNGGTIRFDFRCDSPRERRYLEMQIALLADDHVHFGISTHYIEGILGDDNRKPMGPADLLVTCSWCKKIAVGDDKWQDVENAIDLSSIFEGNPTMSHGICRPCYETAVSKIKG